MKMIMKSRGYGKTYLTNKYHNKKVSYKGHKFDSIKEMHWYLILHETQTRGKIKGLELQKKFELQEAFIDNTGHKQRAITYVADFFYYDVDKRCYVAEDVKSKATKEDKVYCIKKKMFMYKYPNIVFKEIL